MAKTFEYTIVYPGKLISASIQAPNLWSALVKVRVSAEELPWWRTLTEIRIKEVV